MDINHVVKTLHPLERKVLPLLKNVKSYRELTRISGLQEVEVMRALQWLQNKDVLKISDIENKNITFTNKGEKYKKNKLPERILLELLSKNDLSLIGIQKTGLLSHEEAGASIGLLKRKAALDTINEKEIKFKLNQTGKHLLNKDSLEEQFLTNLLQNKIKYNTLKEEEKFAFEELKKRGILALEGLKDKTWELTEFGNKLSNTKINLDLIDSLNKNVLKSNIWKNKEFRSYDLKAQVPNDYSGRRHPYNESLNLIRQVFLEMGFKEMEGPWVETAFWNMDSMWIPQDHPARDVQDTFYLDKLGDLPNKKLVENVKSSHENGLKTGSTGHTKQWNPELAKQLLLRTHSTTTTFRYFYDLKLNLDCKYFYIANNFRNEAVDATHLSEFGQAEGFIMGDKLNLADLMGFIKEFYQKLGIKKIRFKPTFNPYTESSMEAHYYDEKMGGWFALINSGIFRPEALAPYGITKSVIAWGMGSSRIAAILTGKKKLREILGHECDFEWIKKHKRVKCLQ